MARPGRVVTVMAALAAACGGGPGQSRNQGSSEHKGGTPSVSVPAEPQPPAVPEHTLTVSGAYGGVVRSSPAGIDCGTTCSARFTSGSDVVLVAVPSVGYRFAGWEGGCSGMGVCALRLDGGEEVWALFVARTESDAECSDLLPGPLGEGISAQLPDHRWFGIPPDRVHCFPSTSDMRGTFALQWLHDGRTPIGRFFAVSGQEASVVGEQFSGGDGLPYGVFGQPSGFLVYLAYGGSWDLWAFSHDGVLLRNQGQDSNRTIVTFEGDPSGGIAIVREYWPSMAARYHELPDLCTYQRYEADGLPGTGEVEVGRKLAVRSVGVSAHGNVLVLAQPSYSPGSPYQARWLSRQVRSRRGAMHIPSLPGATALSGSLS